MIKNIIFDMGNVCLYFDKNRFIARAGVKEPEDAAILSREIYQSLEWAQMDRGSLSEKEAGELMAARLPERLRGYVHQLVDEWDRPIYPVPGMAELIKELKENGYNIYLLSNASSRQHQYWDKVPGSEYFDGTLISADVLLVKPQKEIYDLLCERFSLEKEECVFIDDSITNAEGAVYAGIKSIVFHDDVAELREKLRQLNVSCA